MRRMRELRILQEENEEIFELLQLKSEDLLLRWINFCLEEMNEGDSNLTVQNFEEDLKDCRVYLLLQNYADPDACSPLWYVFKPESIVHFNQALCPWPFSTEQLGPIKACVAYRFVWISDKLWVYLCRPSPAICSMSCFSLGNTLDN